MSLERKRDLHPEIADVLFMDVVDFSKLLINDQTEILGQLNQLVREAPHFPVELARKADQYPDGRKPIFIRTLTAAYAETHRFNHAIEAALYALQFARAQNDVGLVNDIEKDVHLCRDNTPLRDFNLTNAHLPKNHTRCRVRIGNDRISASTTYVGDPTNI